MRFHFDCYALCEVLDRIDRNWPTGSPLIQFLRYHRVTDKLSAPNEPDSLRQVLAMGFQQVAIRAGAQVAHDAFLIVKAGQDKNGEVGMLCLELLDNFNRTQVG